MAQVFASQVTCLISEGVFDQWPSARVTLIEGGWTWLPAHMWRADKEWRNLRMIVPWVRRPPSTYIREHMRFTIQPIDAPTNVQPVHDVLEQLESDELLLFSSDYPHLHHSDPLEFLDTLSPDLARKIAGENALAWYRI
jgi:predicted TIM-barrel fold metal-dependent hydrolase